VTRVNGDEGFRFTPTSGSFCSISVGTQSSTTTLGYVPATGAAFALGIHSDNGGANLAVDGVGVKSRFLVYSAQTGDYDACGVKGHLRVAGASITPSSSKCFKGVEAYAELDGTYTIGDGTNFTIVAGLSATCETGGTPTVAANGVVCGIHVVGRTMIASPTGESIGILFQAVSQGFEHTFGFTGVGTTDGNGLTTGSDSTNVTHKIAVWINGVGTRYLHVFSD
jgi:hypothetical protein